MIRTLLLATLATTAIAGTAAAADLAVSYTPPPVVFTQTSAFDWSGFYIGAVGGYAHGRSEYTANFQGAGAYVVEPKGGLFGAVVGYNQSFDQFVVGLEAEGLWSGVKYNESHTNVGGVAGSTFEFNSQINWQGAVKARVGVALDRVLVYANGGAAFGEVETNISASAPGSSFSSANKDTRLGYTVGAGLEYAITDALSIKAEYAYTDLGSINHAANSLVTGVGSVDQKLTSHAIKGGVNFRF